VVVEKNAQKADRFFNNRYKTKPIKKVKSSTILFIWPRLRLGAILDQWIPTRIQNKKSPKLPTSILPLGSPFYCGAVY